MLTKHLKQLSRGSSGIEFGHCNINTSKTLYCDGIREQMETVRPQDTVAVQLEDVEAVIGKMAKWKAPEPDNIRDFQFKKFSSLHTALTAALQDCLDSSDIPTWTNKGWAVLIQKDSAKVASNYRPIACLLLVSKLLNGIFVEKIYSYLLDNKLPPDKQKGCRKKSRGDN